ncbi:MAG TPA: BamA/TamA family outer membrane protein [Bryobacteraceae bacterium]|nr:BamA/TamA family outer membrane protein [Bryobacteraceae bacterium]
MRKRYVTSILAVILLSAGAPGRAAAQAAPAERSPGQFEGMDIANIVFEPQRQPLDAREIFDLLPLKRNQPYRAEDVRAAIERLYVTGRYQDIQVDVTPDTNINPPGLIIRFLTKNAWFIGAVSATESLAEPPTRGQIVDAARLQLGDPFDASLIPPAVENIRRLLVDNGYFDPVVTPDLQYDDLYDQVRIAFVIKAGRRARYVDPQFTGDTTIVTKEQLIKASKWRRFLLPGYDGITASGTRSGIDHIRLKYEKSNRVLATVVLTGIEEKDRRHGQPHIVVNPGPLVDVKTIGAKVSQGDLRDAIPIYEEHAIDPDLLAEGTTNLRGFFQSQGYFDATVSFRQQETKGSTIEIEYAVDRGRLHRVVIVGITGNKYFDSKTIHERMYITVKSIEFRRGRYTEALRRRDTGAIEALYQANGFRDVKVTSDVADNYKGREGDLAVNFTIEEGPQYTVSNLEIVGAKKLDLGKIKEALSSQAGQPFSEFNVAADRETIIEQYGEHGFPYAVFEWDSKPGPQPHTIDLRFVITEGEQQFVREVVITGLKTTRPELVDKQLELNPGSPLSPVAMADIQRKLDNLGIFSQVNMAIQNPDGGTNRKYVLYDLAEASRYSITVGGGLEFARLGGSNAVTDLSDPGGAPGVVPRLSLNATRINFLGRGQSLNFQGRLSTLQKRALVNYFIPTPFNFQKLDLTFSVLYDDTHDVRTFESKRGEASAQVSQRLTKPITIFYRFSYRDVQASNLKIDPLLVPLLAQSVRVGIGSLNLVQDRRDDPIDPHKGIFNTIEVGLATKVFGSQTSFTRVLGRNATYYRIGSKVVFARQTQVGFQPAFAVPPNSQPSTLDNDPIPLAERFFGGGGNTMRGFPENQAGPRDPLTGFPLGGSALFFNSTELRFPLYGTDVRGVLFEDAGNIFSSIGNISFRVNQRDNSDFNYMVHAVGFGIRYRTPIGPLRLDLAYSINPPRFNGYPGNYSQLFACSENNSCQRSQQQISHFQFFFSIGQAF